MDALTKYDNSSFAQNVGVINRTATPDFFSFNEMDTNFMNSNNFFILDCNQLKNPNEDFILNLPVPDQEKPLNSLNVSPLKISNLLPCDLCNEKFTSSELQKHKRKEHIIKPKKFNCAICNSSFNFENNYKIHKYSHLKTIDIDKKCTDCGKYFQRTSAFLAHLKIHKNDDCFACKKCNLQFEFWEHYEWHLDVKNNNNCDILQLLGRKDKSPGLFDRNISKKHICKICCKKFERPSHLKRHEIVHYHITPFECQECHKKFTQKTSLVRHQLVHTKDKSFKCPKCSMRFSQRTNVILHLKRLHSSSSTDTTKYPCTDCSCVFNKKNSLNRHMSQNHPEKEDDLADNVIKQLKQLNCQQNSLNQISENSNRFNCSEKFQKSNFKHEKAIDSKSPEIELKTNEIILKNEKWFECKICFKRKFRKKSDLLRHFIVHTKERSHVCEICESKFSLKTSLKKHMKLHEKRATSNANYLDVYYCPICYIKFNSLRKLNEHVGTHGNIKIFLCQICGKSFRTSHNLIIHKQIHLPKDQKLETFKKTLMPPIKIRETNDKQLIDKNSEEKIYQCSFCGIQLKSFSHLKFHEDKHFNLKPFKCINCDKYFTTKSSLKLHQRLHTGYRSINCSQCLRKFTNSSDLKRHMIVHCNDRKFLCPYCSKLFKTQVHCKKHIMRHAKELIEVETNPIEENVADGLEKNELENLEIIEMDNQINQLNQLNLQPYCYETTITNNLFDDSKTDNSFTINLIDNSNNLAIEHNEISKKNLTKNVEKEKFIDIHDLQKTKNRRLKNNVIVESLMDNLFKVQEEQVTSDLVAVNVKCKKFQCMFCVKFFKKPIDLRRHIRSHTKEKPFKCELCSKAFSLKCALNEHLKIHEKNRQSYNCNVCGKKYAAKSVLTVHLRLHTGEMPYMCQHCSKKFRTIGHLKSHVRQHNV